MATFEKTLIKLVRAGLTGDSQETRRQAAALLRADPSVILSSETRAILSDALLGTPAGGAKSPLGPPQPNSQHVGRGQADDGFALTRVENVQNIQAPILGRDEQRELDAIVSERKRVADLEGVGLTPTRTLLLTGAPGVGKTMTAHYLAGVLNVPLVRIDLAAVVSSYLGRTGQNIRRAMDSARGTPCVMLLDEIDALGKRRDDPSDVGELKRIVNVLLLELEEWPAFGLIVAATNHPELLDRAIWRRFDRVISLALPDEASRQDIVRQVLEAHGQPAPKDLCERIALATPGASGAILTLLVRDSVRQMILEKSESASEILETRAFGWLSLEAKSNPQVKREFAAIAHQGGMSHRAIASVLGLSHVTVGNFLREKKQQRVKSQSRLRSE